MNTWNPRALARIPLMMSPLIAAPVFAQQDGLEEIIVTARMRSESSVDAPAQIKAFTAAEIEAAGIEKPHDFIALTPNMTIVQTQNPGNSFITIRGVSQARNSDMPVAVVVDGVLMTNPAQFNQQLFDIEQIEVLKGPQGALYGRNAIGGAISIVTRPASDEFEARLRVGADSGPGYMAQGSVSGPLGDSDVWKYRASLSFSDTDGYLDNTFLNEKADPYKDLSGRVRFTWEPSDEVSGDFRYAHSKIDTTALYFVINNDFGFTGVNGIDVGVPNDPSDTSVPIRVNNPGEGIKEMDEVSMKFDVTGERGTFTSITAYDDLSEILTGDAFDFRPLGQSFNELILGPFVINPIEAQFPGAFPPNVLLGLNSDWNQSQFLEVTSISQELRYASSADSRFRWTAGAYFLQTDRFIGTGNMVDTGDGVYRVYRTPRTTTGFPYDFSIPNPQQGYLSDSQDNFAWAAFGSLSYDFSDQWDASFSMRWDEDTREQTTETPPGFIPAALAGDLVTGQRREETWDALQPKFTLRWRPTDSVTLYGDASRGFRSGGFNQSGVAAAGVAGVKDTFDQQIADTIEVGVKTQLNDNRVNLNAAIYSTDLDGAYYFIFLVASSTQNLGSLDRVHYDGIEFELNALLTNNLNFNLGLAFMDSEIEQDAEIPHVVGQQVPLVSDYTANIGATWTKPLRSGMDLVLRGDYRMIGDTYWGPGDPDPTVAPILPWNELPRDAYDVLDMRVGLHGDDWSVTVWSKNALDEKYNEEFSFPFVFKALPARWGVEYARSF
jgi:iron complex outermembrane recepter protein